MNRTEVELYCARFPTREELNRKLTDYVQTDTLNTTLQNYVQTTTLTNYVSTNTAQTISGAKTLSNTLTLTKTNGALAFKPGTNQSSFIEFYNSTTRIGYMGKASSATNNITIGAEFGDIVLTPATNNGIVIPEPTQANNPATKQYVDTQIGNIDIPSGITITKTQFQLSGGSVIGVGTADAFTAANGDYGLALPATIDINKVLNITLTLPAIRDAGAIMNYSLTYSYGLFNNVARIVVMVRKNGYAEPAGSLNLAGTTITVLTYSEGDN